MRKTLDRPRRGKEPHKHEDWEWVEWKSGAFPSPLFAALSNIRAEGFDPFEEP